MSIFSMMMAAQKVQWIVTSPFWTPPVEKFIKNLENHILLIGCFMEASLYSKVKQTVVGVEAENKLSYLKGNFLFLKFL